MSKSPRVERWYWRLTKERPRARLLLIAAALGAAVASGQAPFGLWWVAVPALAGLIWLISVHDRAQSAAWLAWLGGAAHFLVALVWIVEPFLIEPVRHGWMAPFALLLMGFGLALFWALAAWLSARLGGGSQPVRAIALAVLLSIAELARGWLFTGFPWAMPGHVWISTPLAQLAALVGASGLTLATFTIATLPVVAERRIARLALIAVALALVGGGWLWGSARLAAPMPGPSREVHLRVVQPNAPQHLKWRADMAEFFFSRHLALTAALPAPGSPPPDLVIWSETAVPFLLERPGAGLDLIAEAAGGVPVAIGVQRDENGRFYNSLAVIGPDAVPTAIYDKHHLVPFGEYVPFAELLLGPGYAGFAARQLAGYSRGPGPEVLDLGALGRALPLICYEAIFPHYLRTGIRPDWVVQVTNDAWFGELSGPYQHLALARFRAIEQGLPLVRSANTGVSAFIDARGQITAALGLGESGFLDATLPAALPPTPYARWGDLPLLAVLVLVAGGLVLRRAITGH